MSKHIGRARAALITSAVLILTACGGGGGGGSTNVPSTLPTPTTGPIGTMVTIPVHGMTPSLVAFQSGTSGAWTTVTPTASSVTLPLALGSAVYSVAYLCPFNAVSPNTQRTGPAEVVIQAATSDTPSIYCTVPNTGLGTVNATLFQSPAGFPNTDTISVTQTIPGRTGGIGFTDTAGADAVGSPLWYPGASDVVSIVKNGTTAVSGMITRNVTFTPNSTITLDPIGVITNKVTTSTLTLPAGASPSGQAYWVTASGGAASVQSLFSSTIVPEIPNPTANDYIFAFTTGTVGGQSSFVGASAPTAAALTFPALASALFTATGTQIGDLCSMNLAYAGLTTTGPRYYSFNMSWSETTQPVANGAPLLNVIATPAYLGTGTTVTVPDLSSVHGFLPNPTGSVSVAVIGEDYVGGIAWDAMDTGNQILLAPIPNNSTFEYLQSNYFTYTAP